MEESLRGPTYQSPRIYGIILHYTKGLTGFYPLAEVSLLLPPKAAPKDSFPLQ